jgi:hypothetical protein
VIKKTATTLRKTLAGAVLCAALAVTVAPGFAAAQATSPTSDRHTPAIQQNHGGGSVGGASNSGLNAHVGPLPFTGFDVLAMAAVALAVTGLGLGLQRAVSRRPHEDVGDSARL